MEKQGWKTLAIVFICLFSLVTIISIGLYSYGISALNKEIECEVECVNTYDSFAFRYDMPTNICYCFNEQGELTKDFIIKQKGDDK